LEIQLKEQSVQDIQQLSDEAKEEVFEALEEFEQKQFHHPDVKQIKDEDGKWIWRLKIKRDHTDHRAFIDYVDEEFQVLKVAHRDTAYQ
jgi:mRNA-degrading endonuclease RelE of RelBE toxin-antitoxin system